MGLARSCLQGQGTAGDSQPWTLPRHRVLRGSIVGTRRHLLDAKVVVLLFTEPWSKPKDKKGAGESPVTTPLASGQRSAPKPRRTQKGAETETPCARATTSGCPQHPEQHRATGG